MNFTNEQLAKAKAAKSAEELLALAKENGIDMTEEEAAKYFAELNKEGELADEELNNVAGGACYSSGVSGPNGYHEYAIVSPLSAAEDCEKNGIHPSDAENKNFCANFCYQCRYYFTADGICYCGARWKGHDPLE